MPIKTWRQVLRCTVSVRTSTSVNARTHAVYRKRFSPLFCPMHISPGEMHRRTMEKENGGTPTQSVPLVKSGSGKIDQVFFPLPGRWRHKRSMTRWKTTDTDISNAYTLLLCSYKRSCALPLPENHRHVNALWLRKPPCLLFPSGIVVLRLFVRPLKGWWCILLTACFRSQQRERARIQASCVLILFVFSLATLIFLLRRTYFIFTLSVLISI